jgi:hypothetical protein
MTATLAILRRELVERWAVLAAAFVAGLLALATPLLPGVDAKGAADSREVLALIFAAALGGGVAVAHGAGMVARDLKERRLGFYFARPVAGAAIWAGKLLAGLLLALGAAALALLPTAVVTPARLVDWFSGSSLGSAALAAFFLLGGAHLVAVALASRSRLLALDLVALPALAGVFLLLVRRLLATGVTELAAAAVAAIGALTLGLILAAGLAQVVSGRCDAVRGHRIQASVLWGGLTIVALLLGAAVAFLVTVTPASLRSVNDVVARRGPWVAVRGPAAWRPGYQPAFLVDTASGRSLRLPDYGWYGMFLDLSDDGSHAVWLRPIGSLQQRLWEVVTADLTAADPAPSTTPLVLDAAWPGPFCLSGDGSLLATVEEGQRRRVAVYRLEDGRDLASAPLPAGRVRLEFDAPNRLRIELWRDLGGPPRAARSEVTLGALDLEDGRFTTATVGTDLVLGWYRPRDATGQRMLMVHQAGEKRQLVLHDAWTGAPVATLASGKGLAVVRALFLADGRVALGSSNAGRGRLRLLSCTGEPLGELDLGPARWVAPTSEVAPGQLLVRLSQSDDAWDAGSSQLFEAAVVDLATGSTRRLGPGRVPMRSWWWTTGGQPPEPGSLASRLLRSPEGALEELDPATGTCRRLLGRD